jgi:1,2-diacylglycerol 3-beta-galactosyltransferase
MRDPLGRPLRVLLLFSDTGGGHRSAAEALLEAWAADYPGQVTATMVDVFRDYTPFPFNQFGPGYPWLVKYCGGAYQATFYATDSPRRASALARICYRYVGRRLARLLPDHPADVIVSVHPLVNHCVCRAIRETGLHRPYVTVVTDLWTAHAFWFCPEAAHIIVPTDGARARALDCGIEPDRITVRGLPVGRRFANALSRVDDSNALRARLGLPRRGRVLLLTGGGDGMGPLFEIARAIDAATADLEPPPQLVVIAGRNAALRQQLGAVSWRIPVCVEGFVRNMPEWMAAADVLLTKAGPGTITEGLLSGLPLVLVGKVPGQEDGNVDYVVGNGAGVWEPRPAGAAARLREWLTPGNRALGRMADRARGLADPHATAAIAADILALAAPSHVLV